MRIAIVGLGVSGAIASLLLSSHSLAQMKLDAYDLQRLYDKPCGEATPITTIPILLSRRLPVPRILNTINNIIFKIDDLLREIRYNSIWLIIDKSEWINRMRGMIKTANNINIIYKRTSPKELSRIGCYDIILDCRGPYIEDPRGSVIALRCYTDSLNISKDEALLYYDSRLRCLVWAFPKGCKYNVGYGCLRISKVGHKVLRSLLLKAGVEVIDIYHCRAAPIRIASRFRKPYYTGKSLVIPLGEAAGLVRPLGGEGIRPSILSSIIAVDLMLEGTFTLRRYIEKLAKIINDIVLGRVVLKFINHSPRAAKRLLRKASDEILMKYFTDFLSPNVLLKMLLKP